MLIQDISFVVPLAGLFDKIDKRAENKNKF
mgnify:CR=1 FL=1